MIIKPTSIYGTSISSVSPLVRYLARVGEMRERAENAARCLNVDLKLVEEKVREKHHTDPILSSLEVWEWALTELLAGRLR